MPLATPAAVTPFTTDAPATSERTPPSTTSRVAREQLIDLIEAEGDTLTPATLHSMSNTALIAEEKVARAALQSHKQTLRRRLQRPQKGSVRIARVTSANSQHFPRPIDIPEENLEALITTAETLTQRLRLANKEKKEKMLKRLESKQQDVDGVCQGYKAATLCCHKRCGQCDKPGT